ncbi:MAG: helicase-exonuclease AddAB subunit AddA [Lawsonibacter sp.]|nr:helicase-exonuclease AddAB subunit AddA [Lawsonibacter sp.]
MPFPLTEEQRNIVDDRGGELLVSAAAGSGKTRVLVERLLDRVTSEGIDIDRFLVITYTKAAAAELRGRIAQELSDRLAQTPNDRHLRRQTTLVYRANISTIHSFCAALLRENGHLLDLDPDFRLCDEGEGRVLLAQALEDVLDQRYENLTQDSPFAQLVDTLSSGRDDSRLAQIATDIFTRVQSHPDPARWLREERERWALEGVSDLSQTAWGALLLEDARRQARFCAARMGQALVLAETDELLSQNYAPSISATLEGLEALLLETTWDGACRCLPIPFPAAGRKRKRKSVLSPMEEERAAQAGNQMKVIRDQCKELMAQAANPFSGDTAAQMEELALSRPAVQALMDLVLDLQEAFSREKTRRGLVDFSDLEHFAVKLLTNRDGSPSELAWFCSARYDEVLVDEYQDTNQVQNAIFDAISSGGRKLFQVGDVKQSIYRFRLADPTIFLRKYRDFADGDRAEDGEPRKRVLSCNFRSRSQVLEGCNDLFRSIMSTEFGELDYTDDQALVPGKPFLCPDRGEGADPYALELNAIDLSFLGEHEGEKEDKNLLEARFAARRVRELLEEPLMVEEGEALRPVRPSDVMLLLRSPGPVLHHYLRALNEEGIPWTADGGEDFFATTEVNVALSILQIVDNPRQDIALIAALRSPVYGFSGDKLALLRAEADGDFYSALVHAAQNGDQECQNFLDQLEQLRDRAGDRTCRQLIWHIFEKTNLLGVFGAMEGGGERQSNLLSLYALAGQMEDSGCRTLFQFLLRLNRLKNAGSKLGAASGGRGEGEGVSILSIHRSKGLEKPVVLVCGLTRQINREDLKQPVLFHPELGVGPKGLERERMVEYPTLARLAVARQLERERLAEELRLLYVAMTRAREKLILTLTLSGGLDDLARIGQGLPIAPQTLERQQSTGAWVLLHALTRPEGEALRALAGLPEQTAVGLGPAWDIRWVDGAALGEERKVEGHYTNLPELEEPSEDLAARLSWTYPHLAAANLPSKLTATQIKGRALDQEAAEEAVTPPRTGQPITRPNFIAEERGLTPAQRGTALHAAMQYLALGPGRTPQEVGEELDRLAERGFLTPLQRQAVEPERLAAFLNSPLGAAMAAAGDKCRREFKFSVLVSALDYFPEGKGEELLLQGVIDAWFEEGKAVTVVDFKSDRISPGGEQARAEEYRSQLAAYSQALSAILGKPVNRQVLWFFATDTAVEL